MKIEKNVLKFLDECSEEVGKKEAENFNQNVFNNLFDLEITSPIEQLLYCVLKKVQRLNDIADADPIEINGKMYLFGLGIYPQFKISNYRVDFKIDYERSNIKNEILVECDSQEFHERTEKERRYEKKRDRYLISKGYKIFHYTGKEIIENPLKVAKEIIMNVTGYDEDCIYVSFDEE